MAGLRKFYNEDAKQPICALDPVINGAKVSYTDLRNAVAEVTDDKKDSNCYLDGNAAKFLDANSLDEFLNVSDKFITEMPSITYKITRDDPSTEGSEAESGAISFEIRRLENLEKPEVFDLDSYDYQLLMGKDGEGTDFYGEGGYGNKIAEMKLSELTILNSTDYLRAIYDFDDLVDVQVLSGKEEVDPEYFDSAEWAGYRRRAI